MQVPISTHLPPLLLLPEPSMPLILNLVHSAKATLSKDSRPVPKLSVLTGAVSQLGDLETHYPVATRVGTPLTPAGWRVTAENRRSIDTPHQPKMASKAPLPDIQA